MVPSSARLASNKAVEIAPSGRQNAWRVEGEILALLAVDFRRLHKDAYYGLSGAVNQNSRCVREGFKDEIGQVAMTHS
jgi:hypothetical protein